MRKSTNYESPLAEIISMPLEGVICGSVPDAGGMDFGNPFGGNTEETWYGGQCYEETFNYRYGGNRIIAVRILQQINRDSYGASASGLNHS